MTARLMGVDWDVTQHMNGIILTHPPARGLHLSHCEKLSQHLRLNNLGKSLSFRSVMVYGGLGDLAWLQLTLPAEDSLCTGLATRLV